MKLSAAIAFMGFALLLLNSVESRLELSPPPLFIFGDSFADTGNLPRQDDIWPALSRQWHYPYGCNGRFSNGIVESDLIAKMLGHSESPPAHALQGQATRNGINFAVGGSGVFRVPQGLLTLGMQVDSFLSLVDAGSIKRKRLARRSVALVAVSGNDYDRVRVRDFKEVTAWVEKVTEEIVANVARLQHVGVKKVLVNNLYPLGCAPSESRRTNYTSCDDVFADEAARTHNRRLADKLAGMDGVLVVDLSDAFNAILEHHADGGSDEVARHFVHKFTPCCESVNPGGYCGQRKDLNNKVVDMYTVCDDPDEYFYWDDMNPTQAGWAAVMAQLESPIVEFLNM